MADPTRKPMDAVGARRVLFRRAFAQEGDFAALDAAFAWCRERGFSVGPGQTGEPSGILHGRYMIAKWRNLDAADRAALDGELTGDRRDGPVVVVIFADARPEARDEVERDLRQARGGTR